MNENKITLGLEIMGWDTLEPRKYMKPSIIATPDCPFKKLVEDLTGVTSDTRCTNKTCAWWNAAKGRCGMVR